MAGGLGTRVSSMAPDIPKPMILLCGKPVLQYQIECLKRYGFIDITIVTGHLGQAISGFFGNGGSFGVSIEYYHEKTALGTAGALFKIKDSLPEHFILLNGDIIFDVNMPDIVGFHRSRHALATLVGHPNDHPFDSSLLVTDSGGTVTGWVYGMEPGKYYRNLVNAGIHVLSKEILKAAPSRQISDGEKVNLDRDILRPLVASGRCFAFRSPEYIKDMGTPERFGEVERDIEKGRVRRRNLSLPQRAVFLDRDGTINRAAGFIRSPEEFVLVDGAAEAVKIINKKGYLAIVVTNQPVIARGEISLEELEEIHNKMETELSRAGAWLDDIYFCPHHPDNGFPGERREYKIDCDCRKPKPGMILRAAKRYNIDLKNSWMAGDDERDMRAGTAAGCKTAFIKDGYTLYDFAQSLPEIE
jgi:D-glycero-D-manno-heptose 1,7-bisphosphate phosphatase